MSTPLVKTGQPSICYCGITIIIATVIGAILFYYDYD